jgi:hypothetical protein
MDVSALFLPVHLDVDMVCVLSWQLFVLVQQALGHQIQVHTLYPFINSCFSFFWVLLILRFCFVCIRSDMLKKLSGLRACKHHMQHTAAQ